ncbi:MAG: MBL fold metallo-hydrolase [Chloroflexota bacterium]|nr:MBL fold metallo-hydrolase [Chloroflexota bacterium]
MLNELADGVYVEDDFEGGNVGLIMGDEKVLLVDTPMLPPDARQWQLSLIQMNIAEIYGIVNTDYHPEHFAGNAFFLPAITFGNSLAEKPLSKYDSILEGMSERYRDGGPSLVEEILRIEIHPPEISVDQRVTLYLGDRRAEVLHLPGHTPASLGVYLPESRLLFAGDNIVNNEHPAMYDADSLAWLDTLERIKQMDVETIVPGNGEVCGKEAIDPLYEYIVEMRRRTRELYERGASRRECVDRVGMLDWFPVPEDQASRIRERRRHSVEQVYTEIRLASK